MTCPAHQQCVTDMVKVTPKTTIPPLVSYTPPENVIRDEVKCVLLLELSVQLQKLMTWSLSAHYMKCNNVDYCTLHGLIKKICCTVFFMGLTSFKKSEDRKRTIVNLLLHP